MKIRVEPAQGRELDRLITALLNATGVVHRTIEATPQAAARDGAEVIGMVARRLAEPLTLLAEHHDDDELATVTGILAEIALLGAAELGIEDCFLPD
jgi:hypothetical protein